ncbi:hypothetical protein PHLGIDRAFT_292084 [Phlebiopsis gigantea 11061_1 CR5-6]|uniref:PIN domain-containing protein n=1 Tax=Phlebiopsis gigantea (strain 11061_1 CR5-6) TaxID=745531 RepID=A0A0C3S3L9_PHLG1|nr:hypothetical protein PHLGIDRAFT_292084 [Phlebiopsis gigantea 11061_1 CR5-6]
MSYPELKPQKRYIYDSSVLCCARRSDVLNETSIPGLLTSGRSVKVVTRNVVHQVICMDVSATIAAAASLTDRIHRIVSGKSTLLKRTPQLQCYLISWEDSTSRPPFRCAVTHLPSSVPRPRQRHIFAARSNRYFCHSDRDNPRGLDFLANPRLVYCGLCGTNCRQLSPFAAALPWVAMPLPAMSRRRPFSRHLLRALGQTL